MNNRQKYRGTFLYLVDNFHVFFAIDGLNSLTCAEFP